MQSQAEHLDTNPPCHLAAPCIHNSIYYTTQVLFCVGGVLLFSPFLHKLQEATSARMYDRDEYRRLSTSGLPTLELNIVIVAFVSCFILPISIGPPLGTL